MKQAKDDVLDYSLAQGTLDEQHEAIHVLYSEFGAEVGGQLALFAPAEIPLTLAGAGVGHVAAHVDAASQKSPTPAIAKTSRGRTVGNRPASFTK